MGITQKSPQPTSGKLNIHGLHLSHNKSNPLNSDTNLTTFNPYHDSYIPLP